MPDPPPASIVIPTRRRPGYLEITLASIAPQAAEIGAEVIVVNDGNDPLTDAVARHHAARVVTVPPPGGANAGRNAGIDVASSDLIVLIDDDVRAPAGWLRAFVAGADHAQDADVFGGPIRADLEGGGPHSCGREQPPITTLDLGTEDRDADLVWSANMAIRRRAIARIGRFDESLIGRGEEEDWEHRYTAAGGVVRYLAAAGLEHRRERRDTTLGKLCRADFAHGRDARRYDVRKGTAPSLPRELRTFVGCLWHVMRRRCPNGLVMSAHAAGRLSTAVLGSKR